MAAGTETTVLPRGQSPGLTWEHVGQRKGRFGAVSSFGERQEGSGGSRDTGAAEGVRWDFGVLTGGPQCPAPWGVDAMGGLEEMKGDVLESRWQWGQGLCFHCAPLFQGLRGCRSAELQPPPAASPKTPPAPSRQGLAAPGSPRFVSGAGGPGTRARGVG